jgi:hypothetical protein
MRSGQSLLVESQGHPISARRAILNVKGNTNMKIVLSGMVAFALLAFAAPAVQAAEKTSDTKTPKAGESFSRNGTVIKNNVDICMVTGLRWALHPESGEDVKIYPKTKHATDVLDRAAKNKSTVRVTGTWKQTLECHYVETSKVTVVK